MASNYNIDNKHVDYDKIVSNTVTQVLSILLSDNKQTIEHTVNVIDDLDSNSKTDALSANMGNTIKKDIQSLITKVYANIVDNLSDDSNDKFLSANMGREINERLNALEATAAAGGSINSEFPRGAIVMWSGALVDIPFGWVLCNGQNGTPNLTDKFVKGVSTATTNPGINNGSHKLTILEDNLPQHSHRIVHTHTTKKHKHPNKHMHKLNTFTEAAGQHTHDFKNDNIGWNAVLYKNNNIISVSHDSNGGYIIGAATRKISGKNNDYTFSTETKPSFEHTHKIMLATENNEELTGEMIVEVDQFTGESSNVGKNIPIDNRPAFYEVAFIMKV